MRQILLEACYCYIFTFPFLQQGNHLVSRKPIYFSDPTRQNLQQTIQKIPGVGHACAENYNT